MRAVKWSYLARNDLVDVDVFYRSLSSRYAQRVGNEAIQGAIFLAAHPEAGVIVPDSPFRKWRVGKTPYLLFYRFDRATLRIVRIIHAARDWRQML